MKKYTKSQIESILMLANARVTEQHFLLGHPRQHYISKGDVIAMLAAIEKATQHNIQPTRPASKTKTKSKARG